MSRARYVIVTPARNEALNIGKTLESVVNQTIRPERYVVVSDGSTDDTDAIVQSYAGQHDFIRLLRAEAQGVANFGSKVKAFQAGCKLLDGLEYEFIGNLDGDISFEPDYFEKLIARFGADPKLGLAGGIILERFDTEFVAQNISDNSCAGAVQLFRRETFEKIGGYIPIKWGGIDSAAEILVRHHGWDVRTFRDLGVRHHERVSTGGRSILHTRFKKGIINYSLGYHPVFHVMSSLLRCRTKPYVVGGFAMIAGYFWAAIKHVERIFPPDVVRYLRHEQMHRLKKADRPS
jgi:glycosyltransferase involved in cell wall biosynthesis